MNRTDETVLAWFEANPRSTATACARALGHKSWGEHARILHSRCELVSAPASGRGNAFVSARQLRMVAAWAKVLRCLS